MKNKYFFINWLIILILAFFLLGGIRSEFDNWIGDNPIFSKIIKELNNFLNDGFSINKKSEENYKNNTNVTSEEIKILIDNIKIENIKNEVYERSEYDGNALYTERDGKQWNARDYNLYYSVWYNGGDKDNLNYIDPYTNEIISNKKYIDRDHIIPLGYVNVHGGNKWSKELKNKYAFDTSVSVDVHRKENRIKSDKGPSEYLPPANKEMYCYSWLVIANKYNISMNEEDLNIIKEVLKDVKEINIINEHK